MTLVTPVTSDNCTVASTTNNAPAIYPLGTNVVTWTVTDTSGNTSTCTQRVIVRDTTPPTITCPSNLVLVADAGQNSRSNVTFTVNATDNCSVTNLMSRPPSGSTFPVGTTTVTNTATDASGNLISCPFTVTVKPVADLAVFKIGDTNVTIGANLVYTIVVTNLGPAAATNVVVVDTLPTNTVFVSASAGYGLSNGVVTWSTVPVLAAGASTNLTLTVTVPTIGSIVNVASASSATDDPDPANNNGNALAARVVTAVLPVQFGVLKGATSLNPQTGLYEQRVTVTNTSFSTVAAFRLLVGNINGTNGVARTNVTLVNATDKTNGTPYVQYNSALNPGSNVTLILEFFVPDRKPFTNSLEVIPVLPAITGTNAGAGVVIDRAFMDSRFAEPRFVLEWTSVPGKTYTIIYSDVSALGPWLVATPTVTAPNNRVQWYDDGPPKTTGKPASVSSRYYRVIVNP